MSDDDPPETIASLARSIRLDMEIMNIHPQNQAIINERVARIVALTEPPWALTAYCAISPRGQPISATIANDADVAWRIMRGAVSEPDTLIDKGWKVARLRCTVESVE